MLIGGYTMKKELLIAGMLIIMGIGATTTSYAAEQNTQAAAVAQSDRWDGAGDVWRIKTEDGTGYLTNSWFQDTDSSWYMLGADGTMLSGLVTDLSTGKSYLLNPNHDGTFGRMLTLDNAYTINGQTVYLTFNQSHDGSYGAITSGLDTLRSIGLSDTQLSSIPSDSATSGSTQSQSTGSTTQQTQTNNDSSWIEDSFVGDISIDYNANRGLNLHN